MVRTVNMLNFRILSTTCLQFQLQCTCIYTSNFYPFVKFQYDINHCCAYSEKLPTVDRGTVRNNVEFYSKNKLEKLVHLIGFIL